MTPICRVHDAVQAMAIRTELEANDIPVIVEGFMSISDPGMLDLPSGARVLVPAEYADDARAIAQALLEPSG